METGLKNRGVIVAASSTGIGRATAEAFAREGAQVAMCARTAETLNAAAKAIRERYNSEVYADAFDVTDSGRVKRFVEQVHKQFGRIDVCVTNAGGPEAKPFMAVEPHEWRHAIDLNLMSTIYLAREVVPHMQRRRWGRIITLTSVSVKQPVAELVMSNAVRAAVVGLVKTMANELGKHNITVNNVGPGFTETDRVRQLAAMRAEAGGVAAEEVISRWAAEAALQRLGQPEEIADAIVFLASERAAFITGQTLLVDGGYYKGV
ncbi:MAG TPA: SDR family oxidoreductase [Terriglobales bacterium]|nr:SDR family oxidoreductase [Terriglobales bacterium]